MAYLTIGLLAVLLILVIVMLVRMAGGDEQAAVRLAVNESLLQFQESMQKSMETTRQEVEKSKDLISQNTIKTFETMKELEKTLQSLVTQQAGAQELAENLKYLLQSPKLRGNYGEQILEELLAQVLPEGIWERQFTLEGREAVDAVVRFKDVLIPIDAKFPREAYDRYLNSRDPEVQKREWKEYEKAIKAQVESIRKKYVRPELGTVDFALMFIPSESIYYETIAETNYLGEPNSLYEMALTKKVIPVSPNTFYAFLQVLLLGVRNLDLIQGAQKLQERLAKLQRDFDQFFGRMEDVGKNVTKAADAFRVGEKHLDRFRRGLDDALSHTASTPPSEESE
jgi:DNA recombination protein RmuC